MKVTTIYNNNGTLSFSGEVLATFQEYDQADRCVGSIFEALEPYEMVEVIHNGVPSIFEIDEDLNLINHDPKDSDEQSWYERASHRPGDLEDGDWLVHCQNDGTLGAATSRTYHAID